MGKRIMTIVTILWLGLAALILGHATVNAARSYRLTTRGIQADAVVQSMTQRRREFYPNLVFTLRSGESIRFDSVSGPRLGDHVSVLYDPADPKLVKVNTTQALWIAPLVEAIVGAVLFLLPGLLLLRSLRSDDSTETAPSPRGSGAEGQG